VEGWLVVEEVVAAVSIEKSNAKLWLRSSRLAVWAAVADALRRDWFSVAAVQGKFENRRLQWP
jgi:hypothetical protein